MANESLIPQLRLLHLSLQSALEDALRPLGLNAAQMSVLQALKATPGASSADLARACGVTAQSMHGVVLNLEDAGSLVREPHRVHGRVLRLYLSNAGEAKLEAGLKAMAEIEERMVATLSDDEKAEFMRFISVSNAAVSSLSRRNGRGWSKTG